MFLHGIVAGQLLRKGTNLIFKSSRVNSEIGSGLFLNMLPFFCECNGVRISQNIQNEVSLEIFADFVAYQVINLNWKLNGYKKETVHDHASFHMEW